MRHLIVIFGDQLNRDATAFNGFDAKQDAVWMAEAAFESNYAVSHKQRIAIFLASMRHFRDELRGDGIEVHYSELDDQDNSGKLSEELKRSLKKLAPKQVIATHPGEYRILEGLKKVCHQEGVDLEVRDDEHFLCSIDAFNRYADGKKSLIMEYFYREMRKRYSVLMQADGKTPEGDAWNFDKKNRGSFGKDGPGELPPDGRPKRDAITDQVLQLVEDQFPDHPGRFDAFQWPVTRRQALRVLNTFIREKLPWFGKYQDAMWEGEPFLYHSLISSSLNLKLLNPREVIEKAETAYQQGDAPIEAVEGFIRQILGWREYIRGIYWRFMPDYLDMNEMGAEEPLPDFYWTADTEINCLHQTINDTLENGYAHHIQRLMITGLYALLLGVHPRKVEDWYLGIYVDAVEWVTLPNTLGMSQYGDGGIMASKPYIATGKYIDRMSNYCRDCKRDPGEAVGEKACPFSTLYWDYLMRHEDKLRKNQRMSLQVRNLGRLSEERKQAIRKQARTIRKNPALGPSPLLSP